MKLWYLAALFFVVFGAQDQLHVFGFVNIPLPADALARLVALAFVAYLVLLHPWWTAPMAEANARIDTLQQRELRARMQLQQAPEVARRLAQAQEMEARSPAFLPEATAELATAGLVQRLEQVVA